MSKERVYSEKQMNELIELKKAVFKESKYDDEQTITIFKWIKELFYSNLPKAYWKLSLEKLQVDVLIKKVVTEYVENIDNAAKEGLGIMFLGDVGIGKTAMMCEIGKEAIRKGYSVIYTTLETYIDSERLKETDREMELLNWKVWNSDFVLLDEIDKPYIKQGSMWVQTRFIDFIKGVTPYYKVLITAMNASERKLDKKYGREVVSALKRHCKPLPVTGNDYSEKLQKDWRAKLKGEEKFLSAEIVDQAKLYYAAQKKLLKEKYDEVW